MNLKKCNNIYIYIYIYIIYFFKYIYIYMFLFFKRTKTDSMQSCENMSRGKKEETPVQRENKSIWISPLLSIPETRHSRTQMVEMCVLTMIPVKVWDKESDKTPVISTIMSKVKDAKVRAVASCGRTGASCSWWVWLKTGTCTYRVQQEEP